MILTKRCTYGLRALLRLVPAYPHGQLTGREIAEKEDIPRKFLDQLLLSLANSGIIQSKKGNRGGYSLAKNPAKLSIRSILEVLSGPVLIAECLRSDYACSKKGNCQVQVMANEVQKQVVEYFNDLTLLQLSEKEVVKQQLEYII
ncbi:MAG: hypothetical protein A2W23_07930 [Planctomycetes bacterium RBG_16_43_13]|nr:MAG: hypothetical protein A2W23_07930 [Planctomycetes bacterium RBG_16_43_13]